MEYKTEQNGPVWILGTPVFYEYQVVVSPGHASVRSGCPALRLSARPSRGAVWEAGEIAGPTGVY